MGDVSRLNPIANAAAVLGLVTDRRQTCESLSRQYPDGVRVDMPGKRLILITRADQIKQVLVSRADRYHKGLGQAEATAHLGEGILTAEGDRWQAQRTVANRALRAHAIHPVMERLDAAARGSVSTLVGDSWERVRPVQVIAQYTLDCLGQVMHIQPPDADRIIDSFTVLQRQTMLDATAGGRLPQRLSPLARRVAAARRELHQMTTESIATCTGSPAWLDAEGLLSLFLAGYETTASTLGWAVHYLSSRPDLQDQIALEARAVGDDLNPETLQGLQVTSHVFRETLRLRPPVWLISRRAVEEDTLGTTVLRPGDDVGICPSAVHKLGWAHPDDFRPERYAAAEPAGSLISFGLGRRACPGANLADIEALLWLSHLCRKVRLRQVQQAPHHHSRLSHGLDKDFTIEAVGRQAPHVSVVPRGPA